jgi:dTDP-4-dehydrorhamnose reductase
MLAGDLLPELLASGCQVTLVDKLGGDSHGFPVRTLDITDAEAVYQVVSETAPHWIVNCAAFTAVDDAEAKQELAFAVNAEGPRVLAQTAKSLGTRLLHISTDYVLGGDLQYGESREPYTENAVPRPCGVYGSSKLAGERAIHEILPESSLIVRTSWLHGVHGPNFINTMLRLSAEREEIKVVNDQRGSPTWAGWLSTVMIRLMERDARGIYHASSRGNITWYDFAKEVFRQAGKSVRVLPQTSKELGRPAPRPAYSTFSLAKLESFLGEPCISFQEGIQRHLSRL